MAFTGTLIACSDGLEPKYTSLYPLGDRPFMSGGSSALEWITVENSISDGKVLELRTDSSFGELPAQFNNMQIFGEQTFLNGNSSAWLDAYAGNEFIRGFAAGSVGQSVDPASPFYGILSTVRDNSARVAGDAMCFMGLGFAGMSGGEAGVMTWPSVFDAGGRTTIAGNKTFYASWWHLVTTYESMTTKISYTGLSGSFSTGSNSVPTISGNNLVGTMEGVGESVTVTSGANVKSGYVRYVDTVNSVVYLELLPEPSVSDWDSSKYNGATVVGNVSGATLTLSTTPTYVVGNGKGARVLMDNNISAANTATFIVNNTRGLTGKIWHDGAASDETVNNGTVQDERGTWIKKQIWADYRAEDGFIRMYLKKGNESTLSVVLPKYTIDTTKSPVLTNWGMEDPVLKGQISKWGELVAHSDIVSVILSGSPTFAGVDHGASETQGVISRDETGKMRIKLRQGSLDSISGKYLYVVTAPDTALNSNGVMVS